MRKIFFFTFLGCFSSLEGIAVESNKIDFFQEKPSLRDKSWKIVCDSLKTKTLKALNNEKNKKKLPQSFLKAIQETSSQEEVPQEQKTDVQNLLNGSLESSVVAKQIKLAYQERIQREKKEKAEEKRLEREEKKERKREKAEEKRLEREEKKEEREAKAKQKKKRRNSSDSWGSDSASFSINPNIFVQGKDGSYYPSGFFR